MGYTTRPILDIYHQVTHNYYMDRDWLGSITGSNDMETKPFTTMFGSEVQVSRKQFIEQWTDEAFKFSSLFLTKNASGDDQRIFSEFTDSVKQLAGSAWDSK